MRKRKKYFKFEDKINDFLRGSAQKHALDFAAFLRANDLLSDGDGSGYGWSIGDFGFMKVPEREKELWIWFGDCIFDLSCPADNELRETVWAHVVICPQVTCPYKRHCGCEQDVGGIIFGREFDSTCYMPLGFFNPDARTLEDVKKLVLLIKDNRTDLQL